MDKSVRTYEGIVFDSELEMKFYKEVVKPNYEKGLISEYELQKKYVLQPKFTYNNSAVREIAYIADFWVKYNDGREVVFDTKGLPDPVALLKRKMFWHVYPDVLYKWITYVEKYGGWRDYDEVQKLCKQDKAKRSKK